MMDEVNASVEKSTFGDLDVLTALKEQMEGDEPEAKEEKKAAPKKAAAKKAAPKKAAAKKAAAKKAAPKKAAAKKEEPAEKTHFDIELTAFNKEKIKVIKEVRGLFGLGLKEAKDMSEKGGVLKEGASKDDAEKIKAQLEAAGAKVELK